ncbi:MAG: glycosyltransferase family 39 protein [Bacteroidota bacterium]
MYKVIAKHPYFYVAIWGLLLFIPFLGNVHLFDWDEINFAENSREMLLTGNYQQVQINFQPFWEKPPLFFWLQTICYHIFGVNEFAARLPNALVGITALLAVFYVGKKYFNSQFAWIWVLCITGSFTPHLYYKSGIIDPIYNLFIAASIFQFFLIAKSNSFKQKNLHSLYAGLLIGAAIITKGPAALLICILSIIVYVAINKFKFFFGLIQVFICALAAFAVSATWFGWELMQHGSVFLKEFILYQIDLFRNPVAGHGQPFWYHPLVVLLGCFPISILAINLLFKRKLNDLNPPQAAIFRWSQVLFWVVLILFSIVKTKIVHYSSACYLPLSFLAAYAISQSLINKETVAPWKRYFILIAGVLLGILLSLITLIDLFKGSLLPYIDDDFAKASLSIDANWSGFEVLFGFVFIAIITVSVFYLKRVELTKAYYGLLVMISLFLPLYMAFVVPKIEQYSQGPAITMLQKIADENCYVTTLGYKSYAHYFYGNVKPYKNDSARSSNWLLTGKIDKPVYFLLHVNDTQNHTNEYMHIVDQEGGFLMMQRNPQ